MPHQHRHPPGSRPYLPAMPHRALLPAYDVVARLIGLPRVHRELVDRAGLRPGDRVLDLGCGTGTLAVRAAARPGVTVTGVDPDPAMVERARHRAARAGRAATFDQGYAEELPYADGAFDRVLSSLMLHHVEADARTAALEQVRRVLAPGGSLLLLDVLGPAGRLGRLWGGGHGPMLDAHAGTTLPQRLTAAGFTDVAELARPRLRGLQLGLYRAAR